MDFPAPRDFLWLLFSCRTFVPNHPEQGNLSEFCDPASERLMNRALATTDQPAADGWWRRAEERIMDQAAAVGDMSQAYEVRQA